jgi:hypothetical protein
LLAGHELIGQMSDVADPLLKPAQEDVDAGKKF